MQPEQTVPSHKVVDIHQIPRPEPVLPQPLHQRLQLVTRLQVRRRYHLVLQNSDMLIGIQLGRDWQFGDCKTQRRFNQDKHSKDHLFVALINCLVSFRIVELFIISCQVKRSVGHQTELLILRVLMVTRWRLVLGAIHRKPSHHYRINYTAAFFHLLHEFLLFCQFQCIVLLFCYFQRLQYSLLEPLFPVLFHEGLVPVDYGVETGLVNLEQIVGDGGGMDAVVAHDPFRHVAVGLMVSFTVDSA